MPSRTVHDSDDNFIFADRAKSGGSSFTLHIALCRGIQNLPCPDRPCIEEVDAVLLQIGQSFVLIPLEIRGFALA
jgi:hypothetical protein